MKYYKVLGKGGIACHGGSGKWHLPKNGKPGRWMPKIDDIELCVRGYHLCTEDGLWHLLEEEIYEAEGKDNSIKKGYKAVFSQARLLRSLNWDYKVARLFAIECTERVLPLFEKRYPKDDRPRKAVETAKKHADGKCSEHDIEAAFDSVKVVAHFCATKMWDFSWSAEKVARAAAYIAQAAAEKDDSVYYYVRAIWKSADAVGDAEREWQAKRLQEILYS